MIAGSSPQDALRRVLLHLETRARAPEPYDGLLAAPELPLDALAELGALARLDTNGDGFSSLLLEAPDGAAQIEFCPFGPLVLISGDGAMNTDAVAQTLADAGFTPFFPGDLDHAPIWHDQPLSRWLFPRRLSDAFLLFESLRV